MAAEQAMTPEALDQWRWEQVIRETDSKYDRDYERVAWAREASCHHTRLVREDVRPDKGVATTDTLTPQGADGRQAPKPETAEPVAQVQRRLFPVLGTKGAAKVDWQFVNDHAGQAYDNHYQTIERLAERGGLSWDELAAIIEGRKWHKMNITEAVETVRRAEAKYLSALYTHPAQSEAVEALETAIRNHADTHGPSGPQWNISSILDVIRAALKGSRP